MALCMKRTFVERVFIDVLHPARRCRSIQSARDGKGYVQARKTACAVMLSLRDASACKLPRTLSIHRKTALHDCSYASTNTGQTGVRGVFAAMCAARMHGWRVAFRAVLGVLSCADSRVCALFGPGSRSERQVVHSALSDGTRLLHCQRLVCAGIRPA